MKVINSSGRVLQAEEKLGSDCTGSTGATNRTLTTTHPVEGQIHITIKGAGLHEGAGLDFTRSGNVITFLNAVDDTDNIRIEY